MELILDEHRPQLHTNFADDTKDHLPVVKLFCPWGAATWLLTGLDPEDDNTAFGLCDLGLGFPEIGYLSLSELRSLKGPFGLRVERDLHFRALCSLTVYAEAARLAEGITENEDALRGALHVLEAKARGEGRSCRGFWA
ncbi:DUF2958 domain-containing protein [Parvularcula maris]|uniref:DUF2958 domain-containing protein n=1 Tax=Parvularcula maris TaxID=2965077 RepID=A0A9X2LBM4_9PROT|nr:DUF2958 domain-containing protein [Parvularcula maris]MCQ8186508.1 DUF2958 domain-containing protein [Parvularcula maris]